MSIRVIPVGTKIRTVIGNIEALITGVCIRDQHISYCIGYFIDGKYETAWLYRYDGQALPPCIQWRQCSLRPRS